jgi:hypothetical protein
MKTFLALIMLAIVFATVACNKDKFQTKPRLEFEDYNKVVDPGGTLIFRINYFDKEGDLNQAVIVGMKERLNKFPPPPLDLGDTFRTTLPDFPPKDNGEITFQLDYSRLDEDPNRNDTIRFRFAVTDLALNNSDTITSDVIVVRNP